MPTRATNACLSCPQCALPRSAHQLSALKRADCGVDRRSSPGTDPTKRASGFVTCRGRPDAGHGFGGERSDPRSSDQGATSPPGSDWCRSSTQAGARRGLAVSPNRVIAEPRNQAEHMAAPTKPANVKKALANLEPSTHGTSRHCSRIRECRLSGVKRTFGARVCMSATPRASAWSRSPTVSKFGALSARHPRKAGHGGNQQKHVGR